MACVTSHCSKSAIARPFTSIDLNLAYPNGLLQASALLHSLVQNHAFVDGNKRTAFYSCLYFLEGCGYWRGESFLSTTETSALERLILLVANEREDRAARRITAPYTLEEIAFRLDAILAGSRDRMATKRRLRSGRFRLVLSELFHRIFDR